MRVLRGIAALIVLVGLLVGIPAALVVFGGNPFPTSLSWEAVGQSLLRPASDRVLIGIVTIAGWLVWAAFAASVIAEIVNTLPRPRPSRLQLPALGFGQKFAAILIVAVISMIAVPHTPPAAVADSGPVTPPPTVSAPHTPRAQAAPPAALTQDRTTDTHGDNAKQTTETRAVEREPQVHVVKRGEWLWTLAEQYLGEGSRWTEIAAANPGIDPDRLAVGQHLTIPVDHRADAKKKTANRVTAHPDDTVTVHRGDSLSSISADLYGTQRHWPELYQENQDQITDPDLIEVGQNLQLPERRILADTDHQIRHSHDTDADRGAADTSQHGGAESSTDDDNPTADDDRESARPVPPAPPPAAQPRETAAPVPSSAPRASEPAQTAPTPTVTAGQKAQQSTVAAVSVGLLLAAGLITALNLRRRRQLHARRPGRRIPQPSEQAATFEQAVKSQHQPLRFEHLDQLTRALAVHCHSTGCDLPALAAVRVADDRIDMLFSAPALGSVPAGVEVAADGSVWTVHAADLPAVVSTIDLEAVTPPWPALVSLGRDADTAHVLIDLEAAAALTVTANDADTAASVLGAIALELALSPWAADLDLTFVGPMLPGFTEGLDHPSVTHVDDVDRVLTGLEHRAGLQRAHLGDDSVGQKRLNPDLADAWCPHVVLFGQELSPEQAQRLRQIVTDLPRVAIAAVTTSQTLTDWQFDIDANDTGTLSPFGWQLTPQLVTSDQYEQLLDLIATSGSDATTPAPWWDHDANLPGEVEAATVTSLPARPPDLSSQPAELEAAPAPPVTDIAGGADTTWVQAPAPVVATARAPLNLHALISTDGRRTNGVARPHDATTGEEQWADEDWLELIEPPVVDRPMLRLLGEPDLVGAKGEPSRRYKQRSLEVMLYLLEHPGSSSHRLMSHFHISRDYCKQLISNLRRTLGTDEEGNSYLPELRQQPGYRFRDEVTCDYYYVDQLIGRTVNTASTEALIRVLSMVRGEPMTGAEDWVGVQVLRADIPAKISDVAHELADRALEAGNVRLARWATEKGRTAHPECETLLTDELRAEQLAGNRAGIVRIADRITAQARELGNDLAPETKEVLRSAIAM